MLLEAAVQELQRNVAAAEPGAAVLIAELLRARRGAVYGVGREGLALKGLAMRLYHMGIQVIMAWIHGWPAQLTTCLSA